MNFTKYTYIKILYTALSLLILPVMLQAQNMVKQLSNVDGLSNNSVNCIFEDSEHILWIGTWDGLNAFDGRDFKTYRYNKANPHSISNNVIRQILEQDPTYMWVATDYGVNRWNRKTQQFDSYFLGTEHKIPKQEKSFLLGITSQKNVICYVKEQGLFLFDDKLQTFVPLANNIEYDVKDFVIDLNNDIFILGEKGILQKYRIRYDNNLPVLINPVIVEQTRPVSSIFLTHDMLIVNYGDYLKIIDSKNSYPTTIDIAKGKTVSSIIYYDSQLFIGFHEGGCLKYNLETQSYSVMEEISDKTSIFTLYAGSQDVLWIGTDGQGLMQVFEYNAPFRTIRTNYPVRSFCQDAQGHILVGTKGEGIKLLDKETGHAHNFLNQSNGLISNSVYTLKKNQSGDIFIGTEGAGLNIISSGTQRLEELSIPSKYPSFKAVYSLLFTHNDSRLWLGTSGYGLICISLRKDNNTYIVEDVKQYTSSDSKSSLNNNVIYSIIKGEKDELWLGTRGGGINRFDIKKGEFQRIEDIGANLSLTNNDVLSLLNGDAKNIWVGTSYGLNRLTLSDSSPHIAIKEYTENNGLLNNTIHGILEDESNNLWVSTNQGVSSIDLSSENITNYTFKNGLQNDEFSDGAYFKDSSNTLYFGGVNGFNYFNADEIQLRNYTPTINLSNLKIYNTNQNIYERIEDNTLKLSYDEPYVTFSFVARDFINNENCEFSYRVLNFSDEWINNGNNPNVVITKLPPGKYQLEVKSTNGDRVWSDNIYTLNLDVAYPWWLSSIAFLVYLILLFAIIYIVQSVVRNRIRLNRQLLLEHIEKQHQQKIHESKLNFFTNVAHEFFTPLTLIYGPAQHLLEKADMDTYTKKYIHIIKNNADRMQKLINELMEFRKAESGHTQLYAESIDVKLLIEYISDNYAEISEENKINFDVEIGDVSSFVTDRNSLEKIIFNLISNAFKYTPNNGYIKAKVWQDAEPGGNLHFRLRNSGRGLTEKQMSEMFSRFKIFETTKLQNATSTGVGLNLTKSLVELLGGEIDVSSAIGEYVEFNVSMQPMQLQTNDTLIGKPEETIVNKNEFLSEKKDISILIVEDEKNIRELLKDILSPYYNIREANNGMEGLAEVEKNMPDIIISDVLMPNLDGIELIDRLKSNDKTTHIPIISISAKNTVEDHINAYQHGADLYITKPFHPRHVLSTVENIVNKHSMLKKYFNSSRSAVTVKDGITLHQEDEQLLQEIVTFVQKNIDDESLNPNSICDFLGISKATLYRKLKDMTSKTPSEFVRTIRLEYASKLLKSTKLTVSEIMFKSGFSNKSYFYREFAKQFGSSPKEYRNSEES